MTDTDPATPNLSSPAHGLTYDVVVVGGGAAGLSTAASILKRRGGITVAIIEPSGSHFYQPGWTLVGGGVFKQSQTRRSEKRLIPAGADWVQAAATGFEPESNLVHLSNGSSIRYDVLVVATGLTLDWDAIEGLSETLGRNGVTSNYRYDLAPYTWQLVQTLGRGNAVFTQPPMPIKCAGAPQKAMYLACDAWRRRGLADNINVSFHTATPGLFGVKEFVPALMEYIQRYHIDLCLKSNLTKVDGRNRVATFTNVAEDGAKTTTETEFDMLHVVPPQRAPDVIRNSPLAGEGGWVSVDPATLRHTKYENVFALGDVAGTSNAKTAAAVRVQAPVVAVNVLATLDHKPAVADYDGYGACPLTVERGKIVLAEFGYGGKLEPTLPTWLLNGQKPTHLAWLLKEWVMPVLYWDGMLKGREIMVAPHKIGTPR
ncbi:NAD(P)/FAD-dependent oxidoreductase [Komagataeibacter swingsii]|uniref:Pyridine nucleotide-disulfide oxidoreductase n=1 Tax=Komagataeibacter swingsii TaxID=215220 RepID=A0A2V4S1V5_9PROT|nr:FAD/NAD(P)-binding oxidoreductase [Komagataeibacter swingsii]PYD69099.1 pyridine nucleotide-disulfide oxidoreductase [Komagataeibacter swingsii]GBQ56341.1 oxidoreductase [Komagataeibacter swingsii DSM 16373]